MKKEFIIKKSPLQKIVLQKNEFEIVNIQYKNENGIFKYSKLYNIEFREKSTNYRGSILLGLLTFFFPGGSFIKAKTKERIVINYDGKESVFILFDFDKDVVTQAVSEIQTRIK